MYFTLVLCIWLATSNTFPLLDDDSPPTIEDDLNDLNNGVTFGWDFESSDALQLEINLNIASTWLIFGFHKIPFQGSESERLLYLHVNVEKLSIKLKTVETNENGFTILPLVERLYDWEEKQIDRQNNIFKFKISRELLKLPKSTPITLLYATGKEDDIEDLDSLVKIYQPLHYSSLTLDEKNSLQLLPGNPSLITSKTETTVVSPVMPDTTTTTTEAEEPEWGSVTTTTIVTTTERIPRTTTEESIAVPEKTVTTTLSPVTTQKADNILTEKNDVVTPCPTIKCNCSSTQEHRPWYDVLNANDNSVYFSIIGASALLTGLVVLCVACCCARSSKGIPRTRTHKVAFYKVDDLDSESDEEVQFLKEDGKQ